MLDSCFMFYVPFSLLFLPSSWIDWALYLFIIYIHYGCLALCCCVGFSVACSGCSLAVVHRLLFLWWFPRLQGTSSRACSLRSCDFRAQEHRFNNCGTRPSCLGMWISSDQGLSPCLPALAGMDSTTDPSGKPDWAFFILLSTYFGSSILFFLFFYI